MTVCLIFSLSVCFASAYTAKEDASTTRASSGSAASNSAIGSILRAFLGDAAGNLTNNELGDIFTKLFGDLDISSLFGAGSSSITKEILEYINSLETTTDSVPSTKPAETTTEEPTTEEPTTEEPTTETPTTVPPTTAQPVQNYYYYYVTPTTSVPEIVTETTTVTYEYIPPETIYTDLLTTSFAGTEDDAVDTSDGFGVKTVIGIIILLGSGAAVVFLCIRKRASY